MRNAILCKQALLLINYVTLFVCAEFSNQANTNDLVLNKVINRIFSGSLPKLICEISKFRDSHFFKFLKVLTVLTLNRRQR